MSSELLTTYLIASMALVLCVGIYFLRSAPQPECQRYSCHMQVEQANVKAKPARIVFARN
jgi:hypothetical protein